MAETTTEQALNAAVNGQASLEDRGVTVATDIQAIILAGVHAWGGCPLDDVMCRPMLPLVGRPLICYALDWLRDHGVTSASICANSNTLNLERCFGDGAAMDMNLDYYEDTIPRGPAGCVLDATSGSHVGTLVVVQGASVPRFDLLDALRFHRDSEAVLTVVARPADGNDNQEEPSDLLPVGIFILSATALPYIRHTGFQDIKENLIPHLHASDRLVNTYLIEPSEVHSVTDLTTYMRLNERYIDGVCRSTRSQQGYRKRQDALVHETATVHSTARLIGPVVVEAGCVIDRDAIVIGPASIGMGSHIGAGAVVARSTAWVSCRIGPGAVLDRCVVGHGAVVDGGTAADGVVFGGSDLPRSRFSAGGRTRINARLRPAARRHWRRRGVH